MEECLKNVIEQENIKIENEAIYEIINNSKGGMRDAIGMLDQAYAFSDEIIKLQDVQDLSGNVSDVEIEGFVQNIIDSNYKDMLNKTKTWAENGKDFVLVTQKIINFIRNGILYKKGITNEQIKENVIDIYKRYNDSKLYKLIDYFGDLLTKIQNNFQKELIFEVDMIKIVDEINDNVSRETLSKKQLEKEMIKNNNVSRETYNDKKNDLMNKINELKEIRINNILKFVRYVALALVIALGALDFMKAAGSGEPDAMKKSGQSFMKRMIAVVILFLLPVIVDFILNMVNIYGVDPNNIDCL